MQVTETAIRMPLRPTRTQRLPVRLLWRQLQLLCRQCDDFAVIDDSDDLPF